LTLYLELDNTVKGIQIVTESRVGSFGRTDTREVRKFIFTPEQPLIGIWGYSTETELSGLGVIRLDTTSACYKEL